MYVVPLLQGASRIDRRPVREGVQVDPGQYIPQPSEVRTHILLPTVYIKTYHFRHVRGFNDLDEQHTVRHLHRVQVPLKAHDIGRP